MRSGGGRGNIKRTEDPSSLVTEEIEKVTKKSHYMLEHSCHVDQTKYFSSDLKQHIHPENETGENI